jgi:hypothetical protein
MSYLNINSIIAYFGGLRISMQIVASCTCSMRIPLRPAGSITTMGKEPHQNPDAGIFILGIIHSFISKSISPKTVIRCQPSRLIDLEMYNMSRWQVMLVEVPPERSRS